MANQNKVENEVKIQIEAQKSKEKSNQRNICKVKSTKKVIRLFLTHLFFFKNGKNWVKVSSSKSRLQAENVKKQESREVENKKPTLNQIKKRIRLFFHSFYVKLQPNSSKHWLKPKSYLTLKLIQGRMSTRVKTIQQSWHQGEALVLKKGKNQHWDS